MAQNKHVNGIASHHIANDDTAINHVETIPLDLDDPHKAALEENPDTPEIPPLSSILAIIVRKIVRYEVLTKSAVPCAVLRLSHFLWVHSCHRHPIHDKDRLA